MGWVAIQRRPPQDDRGTGHACARHAHEVVGRLVYGFTDGAAHLFASNVESRYDLDVRDRIAAKHGEEQATAGILLAMIVGNTLDQAAGAIADTGDSKSNAALVSCVVHFR